jgi:hypothetical protein
MGINMMLSNPQETKYICGCNSNSFLCDEAVRLWNEVNRQYDMAKQTGIYDNYDKAKLDYDEHIKNRKIKISK